MPVGWFGFSTGTAPAVAEYADRPEELRDFVANLVANSNRIEGNIAPEAALVELYFDVSRDRAYALVEGLDDLVATKAVARVLGADEYAKLLRADLAARALGEEQSIRQPRPPEAQ
jgi:hypothetical protein